MSFSDLCIKYNFRLDKYSKWYDYWKNQPIDVRLLSLKGLSPTDEHNFEICNVQYNVMGDLLFSFRCIICEYIKFGVITRLFGEKEYFLQTEHILTCNERVIQYIVK